MAALLVVTGCGKDDLGHPTAGPTAPSPLPSGLVQDFGTAYTEKLTDSLAELLHPDFQMILPSETCGLWNRPPGTTFDKTEMVSICSHMFSGLVGRDASGNVVPAVDSIVISQFEPEGDWTPITQETEFFSEHEGLWASYKVNIQFHNAEQTHKYDVRQQVNFYVSAVTNGDHAGLKLLGIRGLPLDSATESQLSTWSAVLLFFDLEPWTMENDYMGSAICGRCHPDIYTDYLVSGHSKPFMSDPTAPLDPGDTDCGSCHATGFDPVRETWELDGVACEACHGMGRIHSRSTSAQDIVINLDEEFCWECHDIFLNHPVSETGNTWRGVSHPGGCLPCHDPHISARFDIDRAVVTDCVDCHTSDTKQLKPEGGHGRNSEPRKRIHLDPDNEVN